MRTLWLILALVMLAPMIQAGGPFASEPDSTLFTQIQDAVRRTLRGPDIHFSPKFCLVQGDWAIFDTNWIFFDADLSDDPQDNHIRNGCVAAALHRVRGKWTAVSRWCRDYTPFEGLFREDGEDPGPNPPGELPDGLLRAYDQHFGFNDSVHYPRRVPRVPAVSNGNAARLFRGIETGDRREVIRIDHELTTQPEKGQLLDAISSAGIIAADYCRWDNSDRRVLVVLSPANAKRFHFPGFFRTRFCLKLTHALSAKSARRARTARVYDPVF